MCRRLRGLPGHGPTPKTIPPGWGHGFQEGVVVEFQKADGSTWLANFETGPNLVDDVVAHPNTRDVLVAAGGLLWSVNPTTEEATQLPSPVLGIWKLSDPPRLLFNQQDLGFFCVGADGVAWTTPRISWDGFRNLRLSDAAMEGEAWSAIDNRWESFRVNLIDGTLVGGAYRLGDHNESVGTPSIPRMPPFNKTAFSLAMVLVVLDCIFVGVVQPTPEATFSVIGPLYGGFLLGIGVWRAAKAWRVRSIVRQLTRFDDAQRARILRSIPSGPAQALLRRLSDEHGDSATTGVVEQFQFSAVDRRQIATAMWGSAAMALAALVPTFTVAESSRERLATICMAAILTISAVAFRLLANSRRRVFELSPFAISEIHPDSSIRRLYWGGAARLTNRRWLRRIELADGRGATISIPYSVVGFERLFQLILERGGFFPEDPSVRR